MSKPLWSVDAHLVIRRYRGELYRGNAYDRGARPVYVTPRTYLTVEEAQAAARAQIAVYDQLRAA